MSMNIYAENGTKVQAIFDIDGNLMNGPDYEREEAAKYLEKDKIYTIDRTEVHSWHTDIYLNEMKEAWLAGVNYGEGTSIDITK